MKNRKLLQTMLYSAAVISAIVMAAPSASVHAVNAHIEDDAYIEEDYLQDLADDSEKKSTGYSTDGLSIIEDDENDTVVETPRLAPADISTVQIHASAASFAYNGDEQVPDIEIAYFEEGEDFTVERVDGDDYTSVGDHTLIIKGITELDEDGMCGAEGGLTGSQAVTYTITEAKISNMNITFGENNAATASVAYAPSTDVLTEELDMHLMDGDRELEEGVDYTITFPKNTGVGTRTMTIKGIGNYTGTVKKTFKVTAYDAVADENGYMAIMWKYSGLVAAANAEDKGITENTNQDTARGNSDYKGNMYIAFLDTPSIMFGKGAFYYPGYFGDSISCPAVYLETNDDGMTAAASANEDVDMSTYKTLVKDTDYTISYTSVTENGMKKRIETIKFKGNYKGTKSYERKVMDISDCYKIELSSNTVKYSSTANAWKNVSFTIGRDISDARFSGMKYKALTKGTNYTVSYSYDTEGKQPIAKSVKTLPEGTVFYVTITGKGNYCGSVTSEAITVVSRYQTITTYTQDLPEYTSSDTEEYTHTSTAPAYGSEGTEQ